jgi:asparagine synthase (glutamine-hydrolysing)
VCGFIGRIGGERVVDLRRGLPWLARRGPDAQRLWESADRSVSLLHARLGIVDCDPRSDQPLTDVARGITVALVGEIYNYRELKHTLRGYGFRTESDTEAVLAAYALRGIDGLRLLKGMYAMALVDERGRRVVLARDPIGKKPLFYARWNRTLLFGSSLLPLVAASGTGVGVDDGALEHYWEHAFVRPTTSALKGANPVSPGQTLVFDWSGTLVADVRNHPAPELSYAGESAAEVGERVGQLLDTAVARRLDNNPQPVSLLSGGIDSTVVTSVARRLCAGRGGAGLAALTLGAVVPGANDEFYARYAAHRMHMPLEVLRPHAGDIGRSVIAALDVQDEPLGMPSYYALYRLVLAASRYGRVLLTGDGGDEVFLGYRPVADWRVASGVAVGSHDAHLPTWFSPWAREVTTTVLVGHMLAKADRASAEQGVELRCPLLDVDLVAYVRSLPFEIVAAQGRNKILIKQRLSDWPHWFLERRKLGFAYNLRWIWALSGYRGLRECVRRDAVEAFASFVPAPLQGDPRHWKTRDILKVFGAAWRLLAWSRFLDRLQRAQSDAGRLAGVGA